MQQTLYNGSPSAWISLEMPFEVKPTYFYFYQGASYAGSTKFLLELEDGTRRLIGTHANSLPGGKWAERWSRRHGSMNSHDYYGKKIYMFLDRVNNSGFQTHETAGIIYTCTIKTLKTITW